MLARGVPGAMELEAARNSPRRGPASTSQRSSSRTCAGVPKGRVRVTETPAMISGVSPSRVRKRQMRS